MEPTTSSPRIVDVIDKRVLGKMIVALCRNEGTVDDKYNAVLRRLLQHAITVTEAETPTTLENAEFKFYDDKCAIFRVLSGKGENKFEFTNNEKLEPDVIIHRTSMFWTIFDRERIVGWLCWLCRIAFHSSIKYVFFLAFAATFFFLAIM
jgi:hypothetical protein